MLTDSSFLEFLHRNNLPRPERVMQGSLRDNGGSFPFVFLSKDIVYKISKRIYPENLEEQFLMLQNNSSLEVHNGRSRIRSVQPYSWLGLEYPYWGYNMEFITGSSLKAYGSGDETFINVRAYPSLAELVQQFYQQHFGERCPVYLDGLNFRYIKQMLVAYGWEGTQGLNPGNIILERNKHLASFVVIDPRNF